jgi:hypothetical protein
MAASAFSTSLTPPVRHFVSLGWRVEGGGLRGGAEKEKRLAKRGDAGLPLCDCGHDAHLNKLWIGGHAHTGQDDFSAIRDQYYRTGDGFLCVYSIILRSSYDEVKIFHSAIKRVKDSGSRIPFVLVGNKVLAPRS